MSSKRTLLLLLIGGACLGFLSLIFSWWFLTRPVNAGQMESARFVIPKGQAISIITQRLQDEGFIRSSLAMRLVLKQTGLETKLQAGSFELSKNMSSQEIAQILTTGTEDVWITIVEGWRAEEIADMLETMGLPEFDKQEFIELAIQSRGQLFPDTYLIPRLATSQTIYNLLTDTFEKKVVIGLADSIQDSDYTFNEILTMASIVEREAKGYEQSRVVAGILWHRIQIGMALQVDATLQFVKGYDRAQQSWWPTPLARDKQLDSAYNTYQNAGLPPGPISNPGLDAIRATLGPIQTTDLYYIHDNLGRIHTAATLDEHNRNVDVYLR